MESLCEEMDMQKQEQESLVICAIFFYSLKITHQAAATEVILLK